MLKGDGVSARSTNVLKKGTRAVANSAMGRRVKRMFDLALNPPPKADPDPGNPVPFTIRRDLGKYRAGFYALVLGLVALTITTPRTFLFDPITEQFRPEQLTTGIIFLVFLLLSHWSVTGSDPGYLDIDVAVRIGEEHAQHDEIDLREPDEFAGLSKIPSAELVISSPSARTLSKKRKTTTTKVSPQKMFQGPFSKPRTTGGGDEEEQKVSEDKQANSSDEMEDDVKDADDDVSQEDEDEDDDVFLESSKLISKNEGDLDEDDDEVDEEPNELFDQNLSGIPAQQLPPRAKFCRKSRRVVATYDHHCRFLNTTIGERNRARFWFLLLWSTCGVSWLLSVVHSGFRNSSASVGAWMERNGQALVSAIICWILLLVCGGLFIFHTFLMLANVTTYEFMRADKVSYLANTRDFDLPFSMGLNNNIKFYFSSDSSVLTLINFLSGRRIEWKPHLWARPIPPTPTERESTDVLHHLWENKYWSCC